MYINIVERENKKFGKGTSCYVYICESKRQDKKIKTSKKHIYTFVKTSLASIASVQKILIEIKTILYFRVIDTEIQDKLIKDVVSKITKIQVELLKDPYWKSFYDIEYKHFKKQQEYKHQDFSGNNKNVTTTIEDEIVKELIEVGYKQLAKKYHPDVSKEKYAEEKFKLLGEIKNKLLQQIM